MGGDRIEWTAMVVGLVSLFAFAFRFSLSFAAAASAAVVVVVVFQTTINGQRVVPSFSAPVVVFHLPDTTAQESKQPQSLTPTPTATTIVPSLCGNSFSKAEGNKRIKKMHNSAHPPQQ